MEALWDVQLGVGKWAWSSGEEFSKARDLQGGAPKAVAENLCWGQQGNEGQRKTGAELRGKTAELKGR